MFSSPACDRGVVAAEQNVGDRSTAELAGAGVVGVFEAAVGTKRLVDGTLGIAEDTGKSRHDGVNDDHRSHFTPERT